MSEKKALSKAELRQKRLDELEQNEKKKKLIVGIVVGVLIVIFLGGIGFGLNDILTTEGTMANPKDAVFSPAPGTVKQGIDTLKEITAFARNPQNSSKVRLNISTSMWVDDSEINGSTDDDKLVHVLKYIKSDALSAVSQHYTKYEETYGTDFTGELLPMSFTEKDIRSFECAEQEGGGTRELHFVFNEAPYPQKAGLLLYDNFGMENCADIEKAVIELIKPVATVKSADIRCNGFEIAAAYNTEERLASSIRYVRKYSVKATLEFTGELAPLGEREISFTVGATETHSLTYAGLKLNADKMWLEKGETDNLEAFRNYDPEILDEAGKEAARVKWEISDPETATVDDEGYVKGRKVSDKPLTLTATYTFLGNTYTDTCQVYVRVPLEEIRVSDRELSLNPGESKALEIKFKPEKATFKTLDWFTTDEKVATVDENGVITAKAEGRVEIFAIALDGSFKTTCKLTVKDGENNG